MKIVVLDGHTLNPGDLSWDGFGELGAVSVHERTSVDQVAERIAGAEAVITNKAVLSRETIEASPQLRYVGVTATGHGGRGRVGGGPVQDRVSVGVVASAREHVSAEGSRVVPGSAPHGHRPHLGGRLSPGVQRPPIRTRYRSTSHGQHR